MSICSNSIRRHLTTTKFFFNNILHFPLNLFLLGLKSSRLFYFIRPEIYALPGVKLNKISLFLAMKKYSFDC